MLMNYPLGRLEERLEEKLKDKRMKATTEILKNMRILKLQAWELKFLSTIVELQKMEAGWLKKYVYAQAFGTFFFLCTPPFVSVATFDTCVLMRIPLDSRTIFSVLATFKMLQEPINNLPHTVSVMVQTKVSLYRVASFLCLDDLPVSVVEELPRDSSSDTAIKIAEGNLSWDSSAPNPTLKDVNLKVSRGMRIGVCGTVGCGKSSLLSYVAQSPWIQSGKIEENILFGKEDVERKV